MSYTVYKFRVFQHTKSSKWIVQHKGKFSNALQSDTNSAEVIFKIILNFEPLGTIHDEICNL
jgi:ribosome biogenesis GTPase A